jgi:16S rRNA (guanine966-N2)-methyltransferase
VRIIAGTARGTPLVAPAGTDVRPMLDRVKESLFSIVHGLVPGAGVLDLFSGTGALGLEALSRGAASCVFVESEERLVRALESNAERCRLVSRCEFIRADALGLRHAEKAACGLPADLVFVDPPYEIVDDPNRRSGLFDVLEGLRCTWIGEGAVLVLHHRAMPFAVWPARMLASTDVRVYGRSQLTFFEWRSEAQ